MSNFGISRILNSKFFKRVSVNLLANIAQAVLAIALLPIATLKLGPEDYGVYGTIALAVAFIATICDLGSTYIIYGHHESLSEEERENMFFTLCCFSTTTAIFFIIILYFISSLILPLLPVFFNLSLLEGYLIFFAIGLRALFGVIAPALIVSNKSVFLAQSIIIQSMVNFIVVILALFFFNLGRSSLILGSTSGLIASVIFAMRTLNLLVLKRIRLKWYYEIKKIGIYSTIASLFENIKPLLENLIISNYFGNAILGIYTHARSYQAIILQGTNSVSSVSWPIALEEARRGDGKFSKTSQIWDIVYLLLTYVGIFFIFWGENFIAALTNNKFNDASIFLPWLVVYVLIQNSSKPATAILFNEKKGKLYSNVRTFIIFLAMVSLIYIVPKYGVEFVIFIAIGEIFLSRVILTIFANRIIKTPYKSNFIFIGCSSIFITYLLNSSLTNSLFDQLLYFTLCTLILLRILYVKIKYINK
jgi:O-antigen/teichoic acid export membrane protein